MQTAEAEHSREREKQVQRPGGGMCFVSWRNGKEEKCLEKTEQGGDGWELRSKQ